MAEGCLKATELDQIWKKVFMYDQLFLIYGKYTLFPSNNKQENSYFLFRPWGSLHTDNSNKTKLSNFTLSQGNLLLLEIVTSKVWINVGLFLNTASNLHFCVYIH